VADSLEENLSLHFRGIYLFCHTIQTMIEALHDWTNTSHQGHRVPTTSV
jgi:hypothetical protein